MKYGIVANPAAGTTTVDQKHRIVTELSYLLGDCISSGLDTTCRESFSECARDLSEKVDVLIVSAGDGGFFDVLNAVDPEVRLAFHPSGRGNMLKSQLKIPRNVADFSRVVKEGWTMQADTISYNGYRTLLASVGIEGPIIRRSEEYLAKDKKGFMSYALSLIDVLRYFEKPCAKIWVDGAELPETRILTAIATKMQYYGYRLKVVPKARMDDGKMHVLYTDPNIFGVGLAVASGFMGGNVVGRYVGCTRLEIEVDKPQIVQLNGNLIDEPPKKNFCFEVVPKSLRVITDQYS